MKDIFSLNIKGLEIKLKTKPGVFSKKGLDSGTKLLLENLIIKDKTQVADLGSGAGAIGIFCGKLNPNGYTHLLEEHLRALNLTKENIELNNLRNVEVYLSDLFSAVDDRSYHQIISNPPQHLGNDFLEELVKQSFKHLKSKGETWLVIQKNLKPFFIKLFFKYFKNQETVAGDREYVVIKAIKQ